MELVDEVRGGGIDLCRSRKKVTTILLELDEVTGIESISGIPGELETRFQLGMEAGRGIDNYAIVTRS